MRHSDEGRESSSASWVTSLLRNKVAALLIIATIFQITTSFRSHYYVYNNSTQEVVTTVEDHPLKNITTANNQKAKVKKKTRNKKRRKMIDDANKPRCTNGSSTNLIAAHPHAGAMDEFGNCGYVHDPTILRRTTLLESHSEEREEEFLCLPTGEGPE